MTSQLLINPKAGMLKGCIDPAEIRKRLVGLELEPEITIVRNTAGIKKFIASVKRKKPEVVLIAGGDGTTAAVLKGLMKMDVIFGLIPTGSTNNIGQSLGLNDELEKSIRVINKHKVSKMDLGLVNGEVFIESVGVGLLAQIMESVGEQDSKKEVIKVLAHTVAQVATVSPLPVYIKADKRERVAQTVWLTITNTGRAAAAVVDPTSSVHDRKLELVYCEPLEKLEVGRYILAFVRNSHVKENKFHRLRASKIEIALPPKTSVHVDGVLHSWDHLSVEVIPGALKVLTP